MARKRKDAQPGSAYIIQKPDSTEERHTLAVIVSNEPGVLARISNIIAEFGSNINHLSVDAKHNDTSTMSFIIEVTDRTHLANIMRQLRRDETVVKLTRG